MDFLAGHAEGDSSRQSEHFHGLCVSHPPCSHTWTLILDCSVLHALIPLRAPLISQIRMSVLLASSARTPLPRRSRHRAARANAGPGIAAPRQLRSQ
eukprot:4713015-Prymnesium_polylepis.1